MSISIIASNGDFLGEAITLQCYPYNSMVSEANIVTLLHHEIVGTKLCNQRVPDTSPSI